MRWFLISLWLTFVVPIISPGLKNLEGGYISVALVNGIVRSSLLKWPDPGQLKKTQKIASCLYSL